MQCDGLRRHLSWPDHWEYSATGATLSSLSSGFDYGADGARTMMLVYNLPQTGATFNRFGAINGSAYLIGEFGMTALTGNNTVVVPIRSGIGLRPGANLGWVKFTDSRTWNPF